MSLASGLSAAASGLLEFLLPAVCPLCRRAAPRHLGLCAGCLEGCGLEPAWQSEPGPLAASGSAAPYRGRIEEMVKALKYGGRLSLAAPLGGLLAEAAREQPSADIIAPVPLHPRRLAERGFNQALLLCRELARRANMRATLAPALLRRIRYTRPQVELSGAERAANVRGAFAVSGGFNLKGQRILLVDDVRTTGATLAECAAMLLAAGAAGVAALTVARAGA